MNRKLSLGAILFAVAGAAAPAMATTFTFQSIFNPQYGATRAFGINDNGVVSGDYGGNAIFTWNNGAFTTYSLSDGAGLTTYDTRINNAGDLLGTDSSLHAFQIIGGVISQVVVPDASNTFGSGINNNGEISFNYINSAGFFAGTIQNNVFTPVTRPGATSLLILGLNDAGDVAGEYSDASGSHGFQRINGIFSDVNVPGGSGNYVWGINSSGNLTGNVSGGFCPPTQSTCGYFFDGATFTALAVPGAQYTNALGINNLNQIVGTYVDADSVQRGFIATPSDFGPSGVPEPGSFVLMAGSCAALLISRYGKRR